VIQGSETGALPASRELRGVDYFGRGMFMPLCRSRPHRPAVSWSNHPMGTGVREMELISQSVARWQRGEARYDRRSRDLAGLSANCLGETRSLFFSANESGHHTSINNSGWYVPRDNEG
jgi:hypothetical protein